MTIGGVECPIGEGDFEDTPLSKVDILDACYSATALARGKMLELRSMPVTWPSGMSLAKLTEMVPEPQPTSRSLKCGLDSFTACSLGSKKPVLFSAVRISWRIA